MFRLLCVLTLLLGIVPDAARGAPDPWAIPPEGSCQPNEGLRGWPPGEDAPSIPFKPGDVLRVEQLRLLESYIPKEIWNYRERFFYEGMQLEIGPCFRDYSAPAFFHEATEAFRGQPHLTQNGGIENYTAGLPFPPKTIAPDEPRAGLKWAWNIALRYQAGGMWAEKFRISDLVGRVGRAEPFEGTIFKALLSHRADRPEGGYQADRARTLHWVAGGKFYTPQAAREFAWRQYRDREHQQVAERSDDLHAYLPEWRRVRRIPAVDVEGLYMPSFSVGTVPAQELAVATGGDAGGPTGAIAAGVSGGAATTIQTKRSGFEGLETRPLLWRHRVLGIQDVLAPINAITPSYPEEENRSFGPWGLSFASDRWDLRRALVLEGTAKRAPGGKHAARWVRYADLQTLMPLYYMAYDAKGELIDLGIFVGRWSEDRPDYPKWPDDPERPVRVIDSVGSAFANLAESGSWRRESWDMIAIPPPDKELRRLISVTDLTKGR